jgi:hypothetical protein
MSYLIHTGIPNPETLITVAEGDGQQGRGGKNSIKKDRIGDDIMY